MIPLLSRTLGSGFAAASPRTRALLVAGAGAAALLLCASSNPALAASGRASLVVLALAAAAGWARRKPASPDRRALVAVVERHSLSRDSAVALVRVRGRTLLVGYGSEGVRLLADVGPLEDAGDP